MKIALANSTWGKVNILRQTVQYSGVSSSARFVVNKGDFKSCDFLLATDFDDRYEQEWFKDFPIERRVCLCMENPLVWSPTAEHFSQFGVVITPFPNSVPKTIQYQSVIQSLPCVPWFYDIDFSTRSGLLHVPLKSRSELGWLMDRPIPKKRKLISMILSSKRLNKGYEWRLEFAAGLKRALGEALDIYGFGHNPLANKKDAIDPYLITVVLENSSHPFYITEKVADAVLGWAMPVYCGSVTMESLLEGYPWQIEFGSDITSSCRRVKRYVNEIISNKTSLRSIRELLLSRLNLFEEVPLALQRL